MHTPLSPGFIKQAGIVFSLLLGSIALVSAPKPVFTVHDKAYYASQQIVDFVRPGLQLNILSGSIAPDGTITARFRVTDPKGLPLAGC